MTAVGWDLARLRRVLMEYDTDIATSEAVLDRLQGLVFEEEAALNRLHRDRAAMRNHPKVIELLGEPAKEPT